MVSTATAQEAKRTWSAYQTAIFDFIESGTGSAIVDAKAGAAKTTTIVEAACRIPSDKTVLFLAFNKSIKEELAGRLPSNIACMTYHGFGYRVWQEANSGKARLVDDKGRKIWASIMEDDDFMMAHFDSRTREAFAAVGKARGASWRVRSLTTADVVTEWYRAAAFKLVGLAKQYILDGDSTDGEWLELVDRYDVQLGSEDATLASLLVLAREQLERSTAQCRTAVDFDDMLYAPVISNAPFPAFDYILVDEAQDTNLVQREMLNRALAPGGRLIAVGDTGQAIYGFRGADSEALQNIGSQFGCQTLPLSISYRCAQAIVREAQAIVPDIEAWHSSPEGIVDYLNVPEGATVPASSADAILCRNTAPLVELAYSYIREGKGVRVAGREIGQGLITLIRSLKASSVDNLVVKVDEWAARERRKALEKEDTAKAEAIQDKADTIMAVVSANLSASSIEELCQSITALFDDRGKAGVLTLSTVHRSKGLEWDHVWIYQSHLMPSRYAMQPWQAQQERNLQYVAITRAKRHLTYVSTQGHPQGFGPGSAD